MKRYKLIISLFAVLSISCITIGLVLLCYEMNVFHRVDKESEVEVWGNANTIPFDGFNHSVTRSGAYKICVDTLRVNVIILRDGRIIE